MGLNRVGVRCSRFFFLCRSSRAINNPQRSQENVTTFKSLQFAIYKRMIILFSKQVKSWHQIWNHSTISNNKSPAFLAGPHCIARAPLLLLRSWTALPFKVVFSEWISNTTPNFHFSINCTNQTECFLEAYNVGHHLILTASDDDYIIAIWATYAHQPEQTRLNSFNISFGSGFCNRSKVFILAGPGMYWVGSAGE